MKAGGDTELVEHPGELDAAAVDHGDPVTCRHEIGQILHGAASEGAAPDLYDGGLPHVL